MSVAERVRSIVEPLLSDEGLECFDIEFGGGRLLVLADRPGGVDLDALTRVTRTISAALDRDDPIPGGRYVLEVSSPGLERRLRTPAHFTRAIGEAVTLRMHAGTEDVRRVSGTLESADATGCTLVGPDLPDGSLRVAYDEIERARTVFEWGPQPRRVRG